jgi:hypothetical protein
VAVGCGYVMDSNVEGYARRDKTQVSRRNLNRTDLDPADSSVVVWECKVVGGQ